MKLNLISSNIRFDNPKDELHVWKNRLPVLKDCLNSFEPDILGTQEGRRPQLLDLENNLNLKMIDKHRPWIDERMYPTLFINMQKFDVINSGDIWLSETPDVPGTSSFDSAFPRVSTWALIKARLEEKTLLICNVHLDHVLSSTRHEQIKVLIKNLPKGNFPTVLMGDFNESPEENVRTEINESLELIDPWLTHEYEEHSSHHKFNGDKQSGTRIDWLLHSKEFKSNSIEFDFTSRDNIYPSDHFPLKCSLELLMS